MINLIKTKQKCKDDISLIENYEKAINDKTQTWVCHHRREIQDGFKIWSKDEMIKCDIYFNRPADELIFLTPFEHKSLHWKANNPSTYKNNRVKASSRMKGENNPHFGARFMHWKLVNGKRKYY